MSKKFPVFEWNHHKIRSKYDTEKKKARLWKNWRDGYSGASFDENDRAVGTEEQKAAFRARNPNNEWIFTQGLKNSDRHLEVFSKEQPGGDYIEESADLGDSDLSDEETPSNLEEIPSNVEEIQSNVEEIPLPSSVPVDNSVE
ncbi:MAG: hypothetical protein SEPTF4163_005969, partial [Sporothrix epigloea]